MSPPELPTGTVTFLFTDIEGSTRLYQQLGDAYEDVLDAHRRIIRAAFEARRGVEVACPGDGFIVAFGSAPNAIAAAADAQQQLEADGRVRVRMGIHSGEAKVTTTGGTYTGMALHEAARIAGAGHGGQVLISEAAHALAARQLDFDVVVTDLGLHQLKDIDGEQRLFQLTDIEFAPLRTHQEAPLPSPATELLGRADDIAAVGALVSRGARLVTLLGPGGIGKTRLGLAVGADHAATAVLVELAPLPAGAPSDAVAAAVATALHVDATDVAALLAAVATRTTLVILDNCEHVVGAAAEVAAALLARCPQISIVATSRELLGIAGERAYPVSPLAIEPAVTLFAERAKDVAPTFLVSADNRDDVVRICGRLDRLPLAIELAARRARSLTPAQIADRLDERLRLLTGGDRTADPRQQTLAAAIDWSHDLLGEDERVLFRRLAVFAGGWTLAAAESVCGVDPLNPLDVVDLLGRLVDRSLVAVEQHDSELRYGLLETIREYATTKLDDAGERELVQHRQLAYVSEVTWDAFQQFAISGSGHELAEVAHEAANIRAAVDWALDGGDPDAGLRLAAAAGVVGMEVHGNFYYDVPRWVAALLAGGAGTPAERAQAYCSAANVMVDASAPDLSAYAESAVALCREHNLDPAIEAQAQAVSGFAAAARGDIATALALYEQAVEVAARAGARAFQVYCLCFMAATALESGDLDRARAAAEEAIDISRRLGLRAVTGRALAELGAVARAEGDLDGARQLFEEGAATARAARALGELGQAEGGLSLVLFLQGDVTGSIVHLLRGIEAFEAVGAWHAVAQLHSSAAQMASGLGNHDAAVRHLDASLAAFAYTRDIESPVKACYLVGDAAGLFGDARQVGEPFYQRGLELARRAGLVDLVSKGEDKLRALDT